MLHKAEMEEGGVRSGTWEEGEEREEGGKEPGRREPGRREPERRERIRLPLFCVGRSQIPHGRRLSFLRRREW